MLIVLRSATLFATRNKGSGDGMILRIAAAICLFFASSGLAYGQERSTICQFKAGPRAGDVEDWGRLIAPITVGQPCGDGQSSTGVFISSNDPHARSAVRITSWRSNPFTAHAPRRQMDKAEWAPYTDRYNLIHTVKTGANGEPSTGNGLLYTAYACVTMSMRRTAYNKDGIAEGVRQSQVKVGLFGRGPSKLNDQNAHDDYWGLGALAGICGFRHVAYDILAYGEGHDQPSGADAVGLGGDRFGPLSEQVRQCTTIHYNYNNVSPGKFTPPSWFGRYPALITHLKLGAGEKPRPGEFAIWAASLIMSGKTAKEGDTNPWLLSWLQVLTYQLSQYHSPIADHAVNEWWKMLFARYPDGGIRQAMKHHLAAEAENHPLGRYIDNFRSARNPKANYISEGNGMHNFLGEVGNLLSEKCGPGGSGICLNLTDFSPTKFLNPFGVAVSESERFQAMASQELAAQEWLIENQAALMRQAADAIASLNNAIADLQAQKAALERELSNAVARKNNMLVKGLNMIRPPGICVRQPCKICPPIVAPCALIGNPAFDGLLGLIGSIEGRVSDVAHKIGEAQRQLDAAGRDLAYKSSREALERILHVRQQSAKATRVGLEVAQGALSVARTLIENLVPCAKLNR